MDKKDQKQMAAGKEVILEKDVTAGKQETVIQEDQVAPEEPKAEDKAIQLEEPAPEIIFQYREYEASMDAVTERVKAHYYAKGHAHGSIESIQIYVKPEDFTAYYVINDGVVGKVNLF